MIYKLQKTNWEIGQSREITGVLLTMESPYLMFNMTFKLTS